MNNLYFNKYLVLLSGFFLVLIVSIYNIDFLPLKYFYDSNTLLNVIDDVRLYSYEFRLFDSYYNTAVFYYYFMPFDDGSPPDVILRALSALLAWAPIVASFLIFNNNRRYLHVSDSIVFIFGSVITAIYCGQRSKELLAIWFAFFAFYFLYKNKLVLAFFSVFIYSVFFRAYWIVAVYIYIALIVSLHFSYSVAKFKQILLFIFLFTVLPLLYYFITGDFLTDHRFKINDARYLEDNATVLNNVLFNTTIIYDLVNIIISFFRFLLPVELIVLGGFKYLMFVFYWMLIVYKVVKIIKFKKECSLDVLLLMVALFITLTIFEPDFGSFVKHSVLFLPGYFLLRIRPIVQVGKSI